MVVAQLVEQRGQGQLAVTPRGVAGKRQQVADGLFEGSVASIAVVIAGRSPASGPSSAASNCSRRPASGMHNRWEASAEKAHSRAGCARPGGGRGEAGCEVIDLGHSRGGGTCLPCPIPAATAESRSRGRPAALLGAGDEPDRAEGCACEGSHDQPRGEDAQPSRSWGPGGAHSARDRTVVADRHVHGAVAAGSPLVTRAPVRADPRFRSRPDDQHQRPRAAHQEPCRVQESSRPRRSARCSCEPTPVGHGGRHPRWVIPDRGARQETPIIPAGGLRPPMRCELGRG